MMRHEISTAGIFVPKPTRKEARHVKTGFFFFFFLKKTGNVEKQQLGQIREKKNKHIPVSQGPDLPAGALFLQHWDSSH